MSAPDDLALVGPYPPGYGGVSVHLQRLLARLQETDLRVRLYNVWSLSEGPGVEVVQGNRHLWPLRHLLRRRERLLHFHHPHAAWMRMAIHEACCLTSRPFITSFHDPRIFEGRAAARRPWRRALARMVHQAHTVHAVHPKIADHLVALGLPARRIVVYPAWLPCRDAPDALLARHPDIGVFLARHRPTLLMMGGLGEGPADDLYGFWPALHLLSGLRERHPEIGLLVFLTGAHVPGGRADRAWRQAVRSEGLDGSIGIWNIEEPVAPLFQRVDLHVRPTFSDGDANSIREALDAGTPVCASDAAPRAPGVRTWATGNRDDMIRVVSRTLEDLDGARQEARAHRPEDPFPIALAMYRQALADIG